jgi:hypothetical protein
MIEGLVNAVWRFAFQTYSRTVLEPTFHVSLPNRNVGNRSGIGRSLKSSGFLAAYWLGVS